MREDPLWALVGVDTADDDPGGTVDWLTTRGQPADDRAVAVITTRSTGP